MQETKPTFIEEMRRKLNNYQIEKLRKIEEAHRNQDYFKEEKMAREALMEFEDTEHDFNETQSFEEITGWSSTRPITNGEESNNFRDRRSLAVRKNIICSVPSKTLGFQFQKKQRNPDMINYLKTLLTRLQSPVSTKRCIKTETKKNEENVRMRTIENSVQKRTCPNLQANKNAEKPSELKEARTERAKFQIIDLNTENNPLTSQPSRAASHYQKIKRKSQNQQEIDIAREKDILQQLIRGNSSSRNHYSAQRGQNNGQKFTLKNLLC